MPGLVEQRLVLVMATVTRDGRQSFETGTGYFVTADLVLTASHVVPQDGLTGVEVRTQGDGQWRAADLKPVWRDEALDALLLRIHKPLSDAEDVVWVESSFEANVPWQSAGYPDAGKIRLNDKPAWKSVGLDGQILALGGGGQGPKELELRVESPPPAEQWSGVSGAPVFVGDQLAGLIKEAPRSFQGGRLAAVPAEALLRNHGFRLALSPPWLDLLPEGIWVLVVLSEKRGNTGLATWVDGALETEAAGLRKALGDGLQTKSVSVHITDALESPGRWLRFVTVLCRAPIAIFDATGFEPAVMLALGVRAVVRRGVTLTSTERELTPAHLSELPFNIQETRLIYHGNRYKRNDVRHPLIMIPAAIKSGWQELESQPRYLDLPAYDAVRCPYPAADAGGQSSLNRLLVLCPFGKDHEANWVYIENALSRKYPGRPAVRMLDVASPRLVGQALYEGIRWATTCVVDWTSWRGNVFFELGVRMACADVGPVCIVEQAAADAVATSPLSQLRLLTRLLAPTPYRIDADDEDEGIAGALARHDAIVNQHEPALTTGQLPHNATVQTCRDWFDWKQEHITLEPHEWLRASIEAPFGKDPQPIGRSPLLFSANADYRKELDRSVKERWLAAWFYLRNRYPKERWAQDGALRKTLLKLGGDVLQFGLAEQSNLQLVALAGPSDHQLIALRADIDETMAELERLNQQQESTLHQPQTKTPIERIRELKTSAKNQRDRGLREGYERAVAMLTEAIGIASAELNGSNLAELRGEMAKELADCYGLMGGVQRRWADESSGDERWARLKLSIAAYDEGFRFESDEQYGIANSYNLVNRLLVRLVLHYGQLAAEKIVIGSADPPVDLTGKLDEAAAEIRKQLAGPRHGDYWAMADLALIDVILGRSPAAVAYGDFFGASPPDFAYVSAIGALRPLAELPMPRATALGEAMNLLEDRLKRLRS